MLGLIPDPGFGMLLVIGGIGVLLVIIVGYLVTYLAFLKKVGPNEVLVVQIPPVIESLTGLKLEQLLERLRPKPTDGNPAPESPQVRP